MKLTKRTSIAPLVIGGALLVVTTIGAATIRGTARDDILRGGPTADRLAGKGGNDRLYGAAGNDFLAGGPGNDLLVGGPGVDTLSCGAGTDTARGDARDEIVAGCEVVKGVPLPPPPTPPPYVGPVTPGSYQGRTETGSPVFLTVRPDRTFTGWLVVDDLPNDCGYFPGGDWFVDTTFRVGDGGAFDARRSWGAPGGSELILPYERGTLSHLEGRIAGRFDTATSLGGTVAMRYELEEREGSDLVHLYCASGPITWAATLSPPEVAPITPGSYEGRTANGDPVSLTVRSDRTFSGWRVVADLRDELTCNYSPWGDWFLDASFGIGEDGGFDARRSWDGSIPYAYGALTHWDGRILGRFDTATSVSGSIRMSYTLEDEGVGRLLCATQYLRWSATLRP
jgi:hemolysin type calcium-binding protein